jgi:hypothetical protein
MTQPEVPRPQVLQEEEIGPSGPSVDPEPPALPVTTKVVPYADFLERRRQRFAKFIPVRGQHDGRNTRVAASSAVDHDIRK